MLVEPRRVAVGVPGPSGDDNVNSGSADIDGCMRQQNLVRRRDTTAGEEFIGVRIFNTEITCSISERSNATIVSRVIAFALLLAIVGPFVCGNKIF